jgi:hypothetical protein
MKVSEYFNYNLSGKFYCHYSARLVAQRLDVQCFEVDGVAVGDAFFSGVSDSSHSLSSPKRSALFNRMAGRRLQSFYTCLRDHPRIDLFLNWKTRKLISADGRVKFSPQGMRFWPDRQGDRTKPEHLVDSYYIFFPAGSTEDYWKNNQFFFYAKVKRGDIRAIFRRAQRKSHIPTLLRILSGNESAMIAAEVLGCYLNPDEVRKYWGDN